MSKGHTTIFVDALWGDSCKGKMAAWLSKKQDYDIAVRAGTGTNAGHSAYIYEKMIKTNQLPLAGIITNDSGKRMTLAVGSSVCVDPMKLYRELVEYNLFGRVMVDERCPIITEEHKKREAEGSNYSESHTGSTKSGTGEARVDMVRRIAKRAGDVGLVDGLTGDVAKLLNEAYDNGKKIVVEGAQSHYLSLYLSPEYPVVTSANCTASAFINDVGLAWNKVDDVCLVIKSAPTRVSQNCGDLPGEISLEEMTKRRIVERGVTTGRVRRKSLIIPFELLDDVFMINSPTYVALTFCDHVDDVPTEVPDLVSLDWLCQHMHTTYKNILTIQDKFNVPVKYIEFGKDFNCVREVI